MQISVPRTSQPKPTPGLPTPRCNCSSLSGQVIHLDKCVYVQTGFPWQKWKKKKSNATIQLQRILKYRIRIKAFTCGFPHPAVTNVKKKNLQLLSNCLISNLKERTLKNTHSAPTVFHQLSIRLFC